MAGLCGSITAIASGVFALMFDAHATTSVYPNSYPVRYWQSYSASPPGIHEWTDADQQGYTLRRMPLISPTFRSGYAFVSDDGYFVLRNLATGKPSSRGQVLANAVRSAYDYQQYLLLESKGKVSFVRDSLWPQSSASFKSKNYLFLYDEVRSVIEACRRAEISDCIEVEIFKGSFPYVYAEDSILEDTVLAVTNFGDALVFRNGAWCRMSQSDDDKYSCDESSNRILSQPRGVQFYSSLLFEGRTLVGEWPTGRIYEFSGGQLFPSSLTPNILKMGKPISKNYEAQSMAMYCGDLFIGYWPTGEILRFDHRKRKWNHFARLFDHPEDSDLIPYSIRPSDKFEPAFFGQRVTALVPYRDSLYAVTSNLRDWRGEKSFMENMAASQYGAVWKIRRPGCKTTYVTKKIAP
jgi:hypothetical protein